MGKIVRLTESDLIRIVKRVVKEQEEEIFGTHPTFTYRGQQKWYDKKDMSTDPAKIEFTDVKEFGPDEYEDFMEYINNCDNSWCIKTKYYYDIYAKQGNIKVGKGKRI